MKDRDGNEWVLVPVKATDAMVRAAMSAVNGALLYRWAQSVTDAIIAAAPQFVAGEVTDDVAARVLTHFSNFPVRLSNAQNGHDMIDAVRAELGPTLGLVELKEPTPEECERICTEYERLLMREGTCGGRDAFDAVRAVMWPKEGL